MSDWLFVGKTQKLHMEKNLKYIIPDSSGSVQIFFHSDI